MSVFVIGQRIRYLRHIDTNDSLTFSLEKDWDRTEKGDNKYRRVNSVKTKLHSQVHWNAEEKKAWWRSFSFKIWMSGWWCRSWWWWWWSKIPSRVITVLMLHFSHNLIFWNLPRHLQNPSPYLEPASSSTESLVYLEVRFSYSRHDPVQHSPPGRHRREQRKIPSCRYQT